jgi:hypothetical protein
MNARSILGEMRDEFGGAEIADWRLRERLVTLSEALDGTPEASLPKATKTTAAQEAAYRFLGNGKVSLPGILAGHVAATARRCREAERVYVVSDTTEFSFAGEERGKALGRLEKKNRGFLGHFSLAVTSGKDVPKPLGVLGIEVLVRDEKKKTDNTHQRKKDGSRESLRWGRMVKTASDALNGVAAIHVMDSEADIYELLTEMTKGGRRFIIRSGQDRLVEDGRLGEAVQNGVVLLSREVHLSRRSPQKKQTSRRNPPRQGRLAELTISSTRASLCRPKTCGSEYPPTLAVNVVRVCEASPPQGDRPVEWILFTSEPVADAADVAAVIDGYRLRWIIEEYFKAIKTGCKYETRELESLRTLTNLLGIVAVIAWRLLLLRTLHRTGPDSPATAVADPLLLEALAARLKDIGEPKAFPSAPTVTDLMNGIARLGGHITNNGPPGWQVLWRGYQDLLTWAAGFIRGKSIAYRDQS